jgi:hypothetical protein
MQERQTASQCFLGGIDYSGIPGRDLTRVILQRDESVGAALKNFPTGVGSHTEYV